MPLEHGFRRGVGFLAVDAPVFQLFERDTNARDGATHISARRDHAEIAVEILHLGLAVARGTEPVQHVTLHAVRRWPNAGPANLFHIYDALRQWQCIVVQSRFLNDRKGEAALIRDKLAGCRVLTTAGRSPMRTLMLLCSAVLIMAADVSWAAPQQVELPAGEATIHAYLFKPADGGPFPAVIAAHGCSGLSGRSGPVQMRYQKWAELLNKAGFAVLFPDSYGSRNLGPQCRVRERPIHASRERVADITAARRWLAEQSWVQRDRISLLGWSNGGNGLLWAVR